MRARADFLRESVARAPAMPLAGMTTQDRFERDYLPEVAEGRLSWREDAEQPHTNPACHVGGGLDPDVDIARTCAPAAVRMKAMIAMFRNVPAAAPAIRANLKTPMPGSFVDYGASPVRRARGLLRRGREEGVRGRGRPDAARAGMSVDRSRRTFVEQCCQDGDTARRQAARGTYDPACLGYTTGKPMISKLRTDRTAMHGGRAAWKEFHDRFPSFGGPPVPPVRQAMMGEPAPRAAF